MLAAKTILLCCSILLSNASYLEVFSRSNQLFSASIFQEIAKTNHNNIFFSPLSAQIILALTHTGAKGDTAEEIRDTLHLPNSSSKTTEIFKHILQRFKNNQYTLHTANKVYIRQNLPVKTNFKNLAQEAYQADLENINFSQNVEAAGIINSWVEQQTENKIKNLVNPTILSGDSVALLVNALYFKGAWRYPFAKFFPRKIKFHKSNDDIVEVDAMSYFVASDSFNYAESKELDAKILEFPFEGEDASLVLVFPNEIEGVTNIERHLNSVLATQNFTLQYVDIAVPKFKIETKTQLKNILMKLGIRKAFTAEADFSGLAGRKGDIYIDDVIQKAFIEVDEKGVEAAAATFSHMVTISMPPPPNKSFIVDRPFIFYIKVENVILFLGRVSDPTK